MTTDRIPEFRVGVDQLRPGVFIRLERSGWFSHPFLFNSFKLRDEEQIRLLRQLGITEVICVPDKSDRLPGRPAPPRSPRNSAQPAPGETRGATDAADAEREQGARLERLWDLKRERTRRLLDKKRRIGECERRYQESLRELAAIQTALLRGGDGVVAEAVEFVRGLAGRFLFDAESTLHLMNVMTPREPVYSHALNVTVLSLMLGRDAGMDLEEMTVLGLGAALHDLGEIRLEKKLLRKRGPLTRSEQTLMERHPVFGEEIARTAAGMHEGALAVIRQHHERLDGSGYPDGLSGPAVHRLARMVALADIYDRFCNSPEPDASLSPNRALAKMFTRLRPGLDDEFLSLFIRCLGVYPPGTVVRLSNDALGMVMAVNPDNQLRPGVVVHDPDIPRKEALIVDLAEEPELTVAASVSLDDLPEDVLAYLNPRSRLSYSVESD